MTFAFHVIQPSCMFAFHNRREQEKHEFDVHEVYGIDVIISTGEGRVSTIFKTHHSLKSSNVVYG